MVIVKVRLVVLEEHHIEFPMDLLIATRGEQAPHPSLTRLEGREAVLTHVMAFSRASGSLLCFDTAKLAVCQLCSP